MAIVVTSTNGHRSRVCELNGNGRDTEALCRHLFSLTKAALKSVACFVVVYVYILCGDMDGEGDVDLPAPKSRQKEK